MTQTAARKLIGEAAVAREEKRFLDSLKLSSEALLLTITENNLAEIAEVLAGDVLTFRLLAQTTGTKTFLLLAKNRAATSVEIAESASDKTALAIPYFNLAKVQKELGELTTAVESFDKAYQTIISFPPPSHDRPGVKADFKIHLETTKYLAGDKSALKSSEEAIKELENSGEDKVSDYNYKVWLSGAHMYLAEMLHENDPTKAKEHLEMASKIISSDPRLILRKEQWEKLAKKFS